VPVVPPKPPEDLPPAEDHGEEDDELFESERNVERLLEYLELLKGTDIERSGAYEQDDQAIHFTLSLGDPSSEFAGFAALVKDAWVDVCLIRDWSPGIRFKFRDHAEEILNTIGSHGVSLYFMPDEDTLYLSHRIFTEGLNFDVFRACVWSLAEAQSRVAAILDRAR